MIFMNKESGLLVEYINHVNESVMLDRNFVLQFVCEFEFAEHFEFIGFI